MDLNTVQELLRPPTDTADDATTNGPTDAPSGPNAATRWRPGDAWLGGGTWLFSEPQPAVRRLIDLTAYGWTPLTIGDVGLQIAATCTMSELFAFRPPAQWSAGPLIGQCCTALLGSFKVWNVATVGGNICLGLPAGPMTSLCSALDAVATVWAPDGSTREVPVAELVVGANRNSLGAGELLRAILLPIITLRSRTAFRQISLSPLGRSGAVVIGRLDADGRVTVTVTAATTRPVQLRFATRPDDDAVLAALDLAGPEYYDDIHGLPAWREAMTRRFVTEVVQELAA